MPTVRHVQMYACLFTVLGTSCRPTDKVLLMQTHEVTPLLLRQKVSSLIHHINCLHSTNKV